MKIALYNDVAFKWSFGRQEHTAPLVSLLNSVIGYGNTKFVFKDIQIINSFDISTFPKEKQGILDIRVKDNRTRKWADVEIQVRYQAIYPERSMYYLAGKHRDQLRTGNNFENLTGIREVYEMLPQFIKNDKLREQYRLHEEWVREQKYYDNIMKKQDEKLLKEKRKRKEAEQKKVEAEQKKIEAEQKKIETEREKELLKKRSVLALKESGLSIKKIAELLEISENEILKTV